MTIQDLLERVPHYITIEVYDVRTATVLFKGVASIFEKMLNSNTNYVSAYYDHLLTHEVLETYPKSDEDDRWLCIDITLNA